LELENMVFYIIAEGLFKTTPFCNDNTCRGFAHRQLWINSSAIPYNNSNYNINTFHWIYSRPTTANEQTTVTTGISDTTEMGIQGSFQPSKISFQSSQSFTNDYSETVEIDDFNVVEETDPISGIGEWWYYQQSPFNIAENEPQNFPSDWESWYSNTNCVVQDGPDLAFYSQQTSTAIHWLADPSLIDYNTQTFNLVYSVSLMAEVDTVWCPNDPTNPNPGHHEIEYEYLTQNNNYMANIIQMMNNLN